MKYIIILFVLFVACQTPHQETKSDFSRQSLEAAKRTLDSIHLLTRKAASKEITVENIERKVEQLRSDVKNYSLSFTESDSEEFIKYDHKKQEETIEWMSKNVKH